jgi:hypothetical protein
MSHGFLICRTENRSLSIDKVVVLAVVAFAASATDQLLAQPPTITLTQVGSPIWRPGDFQLFTAPGDTDEAFFATIDSLLPRDTRLAPTYTTPHTPPYDTELSSSAAAVGLVSSSVFPRQAITNNPNNLFLAFTLLPDPGVTGSSRDFASGPVIPNSLFPFTAGGETWINGAFAFNLGDGQFQLRPTDLPFEGTSHRSLFAGLWSSGNLGDYEIRASLRDLQGNGWDLVAPFEVVAELPLPGDFSEDGAVDAADYVFWRKIDATPDAYEIWRANFGTSLNAGSGSVIPSAEPLSAVPEPATLMIACIGAIGIGVAMRRTTSHP